MEIVDINRRYDLMLLTSATNDSIKIAESVGKHEKVHTMTHGRLFPSYRTDGELLNEISIIIGMYEITSKELEEQCKADGNTPAYSLFEGVICSSELVVVLSTARARPGSSGGAAVNNSNELIGIVSITDNDDISGFVPLHIIQDFIKNR